MSPEILPLLRERRSIRSYDSDHVLDDASVACLLEAARWAPSAGNSQPWAFLVARRGDEAHRTFLPLLAPGVGRWAPSASALVFALHQTASGPTADAPLYSDYAAYDLGQAVALMTVQATALGLSCHQFAAFDHEALEAASGVPPHWSVTTGVAIGRGLSSDVAPRTRRPLEQIAFGGRFGAALPVSQSGPADGS